MLALHDLPVNAPLLQHLPYLALTIAKSVPFPPTEPHTYVSMQLPNMHSHALGHVGRSQQRPRPRLPNVHKGTAGWKRLHIFWNWTAS